jgi:hypothetical protein
MNKSNKEYSAIMEKNKRCKFYLHPDGKFKRFWSIVLVFMLTYVATMMPFNLAF